MYGPFSDYSNNKSSSKLSSNPSWALSSLTFSAFCVDPAQYAMPYENSSSSPFRTYLAVRRID